MFPSHDQGEPILHAELERYIRQKQPKGDPFQILMDDYENFEDITHFVEILDRVHNTENEYPYAYKMIQKIVSKNKGEHHIVGHHQAHAANAFYSSNFDESLIITIDGGGIDLVEDKISVNTFTAWYGKDKKIKPIKYITEQMINIGATWNLFTTEIFGLSGGFRS